MSQPQITTYTSQPNTMTPPIDPTPLLQSNSPTAIILSIAILLWVLRPVMLQQKSESSEKSGSSQSKLTNFGKRAIAQGALAEPIAALMRTFKLDSSQ